MTILLLALAGRDWADSYRIGSHYQHIECRKRSLMVMVVGVGFCIYVFEPRFIAFLYFGLGFHSLMSAYIYFTCLPDEKIPVGYHDLVENMVDTIIVLNTNREILYINDTKISGLVVENEPVDFRQIEKCFDLTERESKRLDNNIWQLKGKMKAEYLEDDTKSSHLSIRLCLQPVVSREKAVGYILVAEDCTEMENMVSELKSKKAILTNTKKELLQYAKTGQYLAGEKERNRLLLEVQNELGHDLVILTKHIGNILANAGEEERDKAVLQKDITMGLELAGNNLKRIRETVREYRESYDGKG